MYMKSTDCTFWGPTHEIGLIRFPYVWHNFIPHFRLGQSEHAQWELFFLAPVFSFQWWGELVAPLLACLAGNQVCGQLGCDHHSWSVLPTILTKSVSLHFTETNLHTDACQEHGILLQTRIVATEYMMLSLIQLTWQIYSIYSNINIMNSLHQHTAVVVLRVHSPTGMRKELTIKMLMDEFLH